MLEVKGLVKTYGKARALDGIDLSLEAGEIYGLLGPNGAGKSTTIKILSGLVSPDDGMIAVNGQPYHRDNHSLKRLIAYVPDFPFTYTKLTGEEHMHMMADFYRLPMEGRDEALDFFFEYFEFQAYRHQLVESYSAGTKQKLLIAQALLVQPKLLLLDEPLTSIDPLVSRKFKQLLKKVARAGTAILFATHILSLAQEVSDRLGIIVSGRIRREGTLDDLIAGAAPVERTLSLEDIYFQVVGTHEPFTENQAPGIS